MARWRRRAEEGSVLVVTALALVALLGATAFSVDMGRETVVKRHLQGTADAAAADARFGLCDLSSAKGLASASFGRNHYVPSSPLAAEISLGTAGTTAGVETFSPSSDPPSCTATTSSSPAVQVKVSQTVSNLFASGSSTPSATGTWVSTPLTGVRVGSYLAAAGHDPAGLPVGGLLGALLGSGSLQAVSYDGLANADVTLGQLTTALKAGTTSQALSTQISYADLLSAMVAALTANSKDPGAEAAISVLGTIQAALPVYLPHTLTLGQLLSVADPGRAAVADASVDVWDLVTGGAEIANGQHFLTVPGFKATVPNLLAGLPVGVTNPKLVSVTASLAAIQPPQTAYGPVGTSAHTAQVVAQAEAKITADIGLGPLSVVAVTLDVPVTVVGAAATSTVQAITCDGANRSEGGVAIDTSATTAAAYLGKVTSLDSSGQPVVQPAQVASLSVLGVTAGLSGSASVDLSQPDQAMTFTGPFSNGLRGPQALSKPSTNLSFNLSSLHGTGVLSILTPVLSLLDPAVNLLAANLSSALAPLLEAAGVQVGGADVYNLAYPGAASPGGVDCLAGHVF